MQLAGFSTTGPRRLPRTFLAANLEELSFAFERCLFYGDGGPDQVRAAEEITFSASLEAFSARPRYEEWLAALPEKVAIESKMDASSRRCD